jgi:hypothetical protein
VDGRSAAVTRYDAFMPPAMYHIVARMSEIAEGCGIPVEI